MRIKNPDKRLIWGFSTIALVAIFAFGLFRQGFSASSPEPCEPRKVSVYSGTGWIEEPFDGDDAPFKAIRRELDARASKGDNMSKLAANYKKKAQRNPEDAEAQFRWGYAALLASDYERHTPTNKPQILCGVYVAMGQPKNPQSFEYARLRFLTGTLNSSFRAYRQMDELGIRLIDKADKDDFTLRYFGINALAGTSSLHNSGPMERCLKLTLELQKDFPERTEPLRMLGGINSSLFAITKNTDFMNRSFQYYQQYLQVLPPDYEEWRYYVEREIREAKALKEIYKQRGELKS